MRSSLSTYVKVLALAVLALAGYKVLRPGPEAPATDPRQPGSALLRLAAPSDTPPPPPTVNPEWVPAATYQASPPQAVGDGSQGAFASVQADPSGTEGTGGQMADYSPADAAADGQGADAEALDRYRAPSGANPAGGGWSAPGGAAAAEYPQQGGGVLAVDAAAGTPPSAGPGGFAAGSTTASDGSASTSTSRRGGPDAAGRPRPLPSPSPSPSPTPPTNNPSCMYPTGFTFVTGTNSVPPPDLPKPVRGVPFKDPVFSTCVVRFTDHVADNTLGSARNDYSRRQAFNADDTLAVIYGGQGFWHLYDARSYRYIRRLNGPAGDAEPQWHPTDPNQLYYLPNYGGLVIYSLNVTSNTTTTVASFAGRLPWPAAAHVWTKAEGSPSEDGRYWAFMVDDAAWNSLGLFTWDMQTDTILGTLHTNGNRPDHVSISPSGNHVVAQWSAPWRVRAYNRTLTSHRVVDCAPNHSDLVKGSDGDDYYVAIDYSSGGDPNCSPANGYVFMRNLRTGVRTDLFPTYVNRTSTAAHFSGKAFRKPGWFLISTYATGWNPPGETYGKLEWLDEKVMAVELRANPKVLHLAHHRSKYSDYWTEPHASVNRDFTRVIFNSNWGSVPDGIDAYIVDLPRW